MTEKKNVPKLRFPGFTGEWVEKKFSEITFPTGEKNKDNLPLESYSITNENGFVPQDKKFENGGSMHDADKRMYYIVTPNSFVYNPARINVGSIGYQNLDKKVIVSSLYEVFQTTEDIDDSFLWHWFKSPNFQRLIEQFQEGGVRLYFYYNKLCLGIFTCPEIKEQHQIGVFLDKFDHLIALNQRKLDHLEQKKKGLLQKLFPGKGEHVPQWRFPGFTGEWEEKKLGDLGSVSMNKRIFKEETSECGDIPFYKIGTFGGTPDAYIDRELFEEYKQKYPYPENGDILLSASGSIGRTVEYKGEEAYFQDSNIVWLKHDDQIKNSFLKQFYSIVKWNGLEGSTIKRLYNKNILKTEIVLPAPLEQEKIGSFFADLDHLIARQRRKLDHLQTQKKALLQQLFV